VESGERRRAWSRRTPENVDSENAGNGGFERTSETVEFRERWRRWI